MSISFEQLSTHVQGIAPWRFAADWDNVGELIVPFARSTGVGTVMLTIDLTAAVLDEAVAAGANAVVAYHPPIFKPLRAVRLGDPASNVVARCMAEHVGVISPHTALDAAPGGVNDWLAAAVGAGTIEPIERPAPGGGLYKVIVFVPPADADALRAKLSESGAGVIGDYTQCSYSVRGEGTFLGGDATNPAVGQKGRLERVEELRMEMVCTADELPAVRTAVYAHHPYEEPAWDVYPLVEAPDAAVGQGRRIVLDEPATLNTLIERIKAALGLPAVRVAMPADWSDEREVRTVGLCAGAGGSVVSQVPADVYLTGEMRHHDLLAANAHGTAVILTDHSNTERGYLPTLRQRLTEVSGGAVDVRVSEVDADPLRVV